MCGRLEADPFSGAVYVFRNKRATAVRFLSTTAKGFGFV